MKIKVEMEIEAKDKKYDGYLKKAEWCELDIRVYHELVALLDKQGFYVHGGSWEADNGLGSTIKHLYPLLKR